MSDIDFILVFIVVGCFVGLFSHISWFPPFITIRLSCGPQSHLHPLSLMLSLWVLLSSSGENISGGKSALRWKLNKCEFSV